MLVPNPPDAPLQFTDVRDRPIEETVRDTLTWFGDRELSAGLTADRETKALADL